MGIPYAFFQDTKWHDAPFFRFDGESVEKGHITQEELTEAKHDSRTDGLLKPLFDHICEPTMALLKAPRPSEMLGAPQPEVAHYLCDFTRRPPFCSCPGAI